MKRVRFCNLPKKHIRYGDPEALKKEVIVYVLDARDINGQLQVKVNDNVWMCIEEVFDYHGQQNDGYHFYDDEGNLNSFLHFEILE